MDPAPSEQVTVAATPMQRRVRRSALLILAALGVECLSLVWKSPLSFFVFLGVSGFLALLGAGSFLLSLVSPEAREP